MKRCSPPGPRPNLTGYRKPQNTGRKVAGLVCSGRCCCSGTPGISLKMLFLGTLVILSGCPTFRARRPQLVGYEYCRRIRRWQSNCSQAQLVCKLVLETEEESRKDPPSKLTREVGNERRPVWS